MSEKYFNKLLYAFIFFIFAATFIRWGYKLCPDSGGYMAMSITREPVYPLFLLILRKIFGYSEIYLYAASFITNILASFAVYFATIKIKKLFNLNNIFAFIISLFMLTPYYITAAIFKDAPTPCEILTESLTIPFYMIYFVFLLEHLINNDNASYIKAVILSILLSLTRGQMMICFVVIMLAGVSKCMNKFTGGGGYYKSLLKYILVFAASFLITFLLSRNYFYITKGRFIGNTYGPITAASGVLLSADESHSELFNNNKNIKELYQKIAAEITKNGHRENIWTSNFFTRGRLAMDAHDPVKFYISEPLVKDYILNSGVTDETELALENDKIHSEFIKTLLPKVYKNWLKIYASYVIMAYIRAVSMYRPAFSFYALALYIAALILLFACIKKRNKSAALFMFLSLLSITGFSTGVSLFIMPLSRYVIYNMPFIYAAILICLLKIMSKNI